MEALNALLTEAVRLGNDPYGARFHLYSISLHKLANQGGQIGPDRIRTHAWLEQNGVALVKTIERGSNLTGLKSRIQLSALVTLIDEHSLATAQLKHSPDLKAILDDPPLSEAAWILQIYPGLDSLDEAEAARQYHITEIDIESLGRFILWLSGKACQLSMRRKEVMFRQAMLIYRVACFSRGIFLQRPKQSHFGRTYYEGISVQNVHRSLRQAMLGDCWEYDLVSAVVAWKLGFAKQYAEFTGNTASLERLFPTLLIYLEDKDDLIRTICADTCTKDTKADKDAKRLRIKSALTALSFGARIRLGGWRDDSGAWHVPAISNILKDSLERKRFVESLSTQAYLNEQRKLDQFIYQAHLASNQSLRVDPKLQTGSGRPSRAKVLAYLYQHAETRTMDIFRAELSKANRTILASIHDAIIVRERLSVHEREEIVRRVRQATHNPYWRLSQRRIQRFEAQIVDKNNALPD